MSIKWKNFLKTAGPLIVLILATVCELYLHEKHWPLQPLLVVYGVVIGLQLVTWILILYLHGCWHKDYRQYLKIPARTALIIGLLWSVIQIVWLQQWWTWLNLFSQPFIYALIAVGVFNLYKISIDQVNKIRHYNVG